MTTVEILARRRERINELLQRESIQFADWFVESGYYRAETIESGVKWYRNNHEPGLTTHQLYEKFKSQ